MPHHKGYRAKTRDLFSKPFRRHGPVPLSRTMVAFQRGDYVDIKVDGSVHKGMPYKFYHGKTGKVFNVSVHGIGVIVNKQVRNRIIKKRINVRPEHLTKSRCREEFLARVIDNEKARNEGRTSELKREAAAPSEGHFVVTKGTEVIDQHPPVYKFII
ncbi:unnamed protein product [Blepharisma stoltei]|uniref:60S ribosomal protein L21 n=1 Tax=Blepharisma stoltei TaxID=1481888 RepID=A0AAU9JMP1_9CILI|nr:unnamed protein product [Blepharisma stoltei]